MKPKTKTCGFLVVPTEFGWGEGGVGGDRLGAWGLGAWGDRGRGGGGVGGEWVIGGGGRNLDVCC